MKLTTIIQALSILLMSMSAVLSEDVQRIPAPVARYTFDDPFGFQEPNAIGADYAAVVTRNNIQQSPPRREPGVFGNALRHGNRAAVASVFPADRTFTVSFWIFPEALDAGSVYSCRSVFRIGIDRFKSELFLTTGKATIRGEIRLNEWSCVTMTHDGNSMSLFVNGSLAGTTEAPLAENPHGKPILFSSNAAAHHQFEGLIDEVRVYDQVLSSHQIAVISDRKRALTMLPPVADAGADHTLYMTKETTVSTLLTGRATGAAVDSVAWSVVARPEGAAVRIHSPDSLKSKVTLNQTGDYVLRLTTANTDGESADDVRVVVFPPHPEPPATKLFANPDQPGTHRPSFREYAAGSPAPYRDEFVAKHFPDTPPKMHLEGFAEERFRTPPPPYQHPRVFFNHEDLKSMRERLRYTRAGQSAISKVRTFYEMSTRSNGGVPTDYYYESTENGQAKGYRWGNGAAASYCNGAFLALIDADTRLARRLIKGAVRCADAQLAYWEQASPEKRRDWQHFGHGMLARYATSYVYDFLYPWMTPEEQAKLREVISKATRGVDSIGMYAVPGGHGSSNWICWVTGDLLTNICAIEGEDGFDPVVYAEAARAMKHFYRVGIHPDGSPFEGLGKNSLAAQNLLLLAKRGEFALASENVYNHLARFHLHTMQPYGSLFITDDLWGSSSDKGKPADAAVLKYAYPNDPVIDFVYRNVVKGNEYEVSALGSVYVYTNGLVNCWVGEDWGGDADWNTHARQALAKASLDQHFNYTNVVTARTAWQQDAAYLYFLPRLHGGHASPARGTFVYSTLGRDWSVYPLGHNHKSSLQHSVVTVDNKSASARFGRMVAFDSNRRRTLAACDLRHVYANQRLRSSNDYRLTPASEPWNDLPWWQQPNWLTGDRPGLATAPARSRQPGVRLAHRAVSLVKEEQPYALIVDRLNFDRRPHDYRWQMVLPKDLAGQVEVSEGDTVVTDPATGNVLLIRLLNHNPDYKVSAGPNSMGIETVAFETRIDEARFEVMLMALRKGQSIPQRKSTIAGLTASLRETNAVIDTESAKIDNEERAARDAMIAEIGDFTPESLGEPLQIAFANEDEIARVPGYLDQAWQFDGKQSLVLKGKVPPFGNRSPFTLALWAKSENGGTGYNYFNNNGNRGLSFNIHQGRLRISTAGQWYWHSSLDSSRQNWVHLAVTCDGRSMSIYEHGELIRNAPIEREIAGREGAAFGAGYVGLIESPIFFEKALTAEQIKRWYQYQTLQRRRQERSVESGAEF